ncbi:hypothetical protein BZG36_02777 [Bifiguratus adelaidae]|uniref:beta-N-acetylhexosaminidase n=1 Tax=Bifiguratus adelaidae TaxID=1938954 RepID=A0A261Y1Y1_9FUNG|nr:hypothetical protein BZG36_02777 [Bifiguratus adelaidae]
MADQAVVDALPYIDKEIDDDGARDAVDKLIEAELRRTPRREPEHPKTIPLFDKDPMLKEDWKRVQQRKPLSALDNERYSLPGPINDKDPESCRESVENTKSQLEHQTLRLLNLELLSKFGANSWRLHNYQQEYQLAQLQKQVETYKEKVLEINRQRRFDQTQAGNTLSSLENKWTNLISSTLQVEIACASLEEELHELRAYEALIDMETVPVELQDGMTEVMRHAPRCNFATEDSMQENDGVCKWRVRFAYDPDLKPGHCIITAETDPGRKGGHDFVMDITIHYHRRIEAFRCVGRVLAATRLTLNEASSFLSHSEEAQFETAGRNGVMQVDSVYFILRSMALMGLNMLQLYTEDTFEVENEPFFGYLRGRYSQKELASIDDYAYDLGIEVIPCIQTLGHMGQMLQWPRYTYLRDTYEVLLAGSEDTYDFLEKLIKAATAPFRSKRIHIGMDEAHGVGEGRYRQFFGYRDSTQVFVEHLARVNEICKRMDLQPMIWSDMLFCLATKNNTLQGYYESNAPPELNDSIPPEIDLVYWDYYHTSIDVYSAKIQQHRELGCERPWVANGAWTWSRFWTALPFTFETVKASSIAAKDKKHGVQNAFLTIWGDEGNECDMYSALPALLYFAEHAYTPEGSIDPRMLKAKFDGICGGTLDDFIFASQLDDVHTNLAVLEHTNEACSNSLKTHFAPNMSKYLLWEDPFLSFLSPQYAGYNLESHYGNLSAYLHAVVIAAKSNDNPYPLNARLELAARLATVLSLKCHLRERLVEAYRAGRKQELYSLAQGRLRTLEEEVEGLWRYHRTMWMNMYKPFGWETLELRYGGLIARIKTMYDRIMEYVAFTLSDDLTSEELDTAFIHKEEENGERGDMNQTRNGIKHRNTSVIEEFEQELHCIYENARTNIMLDHGRVATPSRLG